MNDPNQGRSIPEVARAVPQGKPLGPQSAFPKGKAIQPGLPGRPFFPRSRFGRCVSADSPSSAHHPFIFDIPDRQNP